MRKQEYKYIFSIIKPYIGKEILGFILIIISTAISLSNPYIIKLIIDVAIAKKDVKKLMIFVIIFIIIYILGIIINVIQSYIFTYIGERLLYDLRLKLYENIAKKPITFFNIKQTGEIMSRILNELQDVVNLFAGIIINIVTQLATLVITSIIMFTLNRNITIISLFIIPLVYMVLRYYNPVFRKINLLLAQIYANVNNTLQENILNIKFIKYTNAYKYAERRFSLVLHEYIKKNLELCI